MSTEPTYETQRIDHLGIVAGVCQEINLIEQINRQVKPSERKVSCGKGAQAMILNALGFVGRALYLTPGYLDNKPVDVLIGEDVSAADFNDDTLARCLDDLYEAGVTEVFYQVAGHAMQVYGITSQYVHLDSSSFHLHGVYERQEPEREAISVTYGYSKDHRADLKQASKPNRSPNTPGGVGHQRQTNRKSSDTICKVAWWSIQRLERKPNASLGGSSLAPMNWTPAACRQLGC